MRGRARLAAAPFLWPHAAAPAPVAPALAAAGERGLCLQTRLGQWQGRGEGEGGKQGRLDRG